jgi:TolA-binding protein
MSDPVRLLDGGADEFEAELLRAGRADAVSAHSRKQILAGVGIGGLLTASTMASGVRAAAKTWVTTLGAGTVSAIAIWAGVHAVTSKPAPLPVPAAAKVAAPVRAAVQQQPSEPVVASTADPEPAPATAAPPPKPAAHNATTPDTSLAAELTAIEQARAAFLAHDYGQALRLLDDYSRRFPKPQLRSEATVMRVESLARRGDRDGAARIGRDFLQNHPNGPYAQRVRSLIGEGSASGHAP